MTRFSKFRLARILGTALFLGVGGILGVWLRTLPAFESEPWVGIAFYHILGVEK